MLYEPTRELISDLFTVLMVQILKDLRTIMRDTYFQRKRSHGEIYSSKRKNKYIGNPLDNAT